MKIEKISIKTIRQQVYDQLKKKIISAEISPGQIMTLQGLAKEFGVSLMPVREALWQLESEKVIIIQSNKRIFVNFMNQKEMEEAIEIRMVLESWVVERFWDRIDKSDLAKIKQILDSMEASIDKPKRYVTLNRQFHATLCSFSDSPMLIQIIDSLWARIGPYLYIAGEKTGDQSYPMDCHRHIYEGLVERDKEKLKKWLCEDLKWAANFTVPYLEKTPDGE